MDENAPSGTQSGIALHATSKWGPFAKGTVTVGRVLAPVTNPADRQVDVALASVSPLADAQSGLAASGALTAEVAPGPIRPGDSALVTVSGTAPARPGSYRAQLKLVGEAGVAIGTPLRIDVAASPLWGVICLLFGLTLLGLIRLLSGAGDVEELTRQAILERDAIRADWDRNPPPASRAMAVAEIERNFDDALRTLADPRGFSVLDRRVAGASAYLTAARDAETKLRDATGEPAGALETADLERDWEAFKTTAAGLAAPPGERGPTGQDLAGHVHDLMEGARARIVAGPALAYVAGLEPQFERVKLALAAGEDKRARDMALAMRQWKRRAADDLGKRQTLMMHLATTGVDLLALDARLRALALDETIPPEARAKWIANLDAANARLADGLTLENFAEASRLAQETETQSMRDQEAALLARLPAAANDLSLSAVEAAFAQMGPPGQANDAEYAAGMAKVFEAWRASLGPVLDKETRERMQAAAASGIEAANRGDKQGIKQAYMSLKSEWKAYTPKHIALTSNRIVAPVCANWRDEVSQRLAVTGEQIKLASDRPEFDDWDKALDRAQLALQAVSTADTNCIGKVADAALSAFDLSKSTFQQILKDAGIPMDARLDAAKRSGDEATVALVEKLMTEPRDLEVKAATAEAERVVGRPIHVTLAGLDPYWRTGVEVAVDWGDGSTHLRTDAEKLREDEQLEHTYRTIGTFAPSATASLDGRTIGIGTMKLTVNRSPASLAERLADIFLTTQFGLALLIASVVYYWRFHSGTVTFGSSSVHYVQAFVLGFAAYAAVADLPKALAELAVR